MKKIIIALLLIFPILANAQNTEAGKFFDEYSGKEGYTSVHITKYMFILFKKINNAQEESEFNEIIPKLKSIKILTVDKKLSTNNAFGENLNNFFKGSEYKNLMTIKKSGENIHFFINEKDDVIRELVMTITGDSPVLIYLEGDIDLNQISKLSKLMNIKGLEHLEQIDNKK